MADADLPSSLPKTALQPLLNVPLPFLKRVDCFVRIWGLKILVITFFKIRRTFFPQPASTLPTYTKVYPIRPMVENRIFIPRSYKAGGPRPPLHISIHGGAYAFCDPQSDDNTISALAHKHNILVVSIGYRLAPLHPWPTAVYDCAAIASAVLDDPDIPYDHSKGVSIGGFSAGGNLCLTASQTPALKGRIGGILALYPSTDFARPLEQKVRERPTAPGFEKDMLLNLTDAMRWGYVPAGTDRRNPLLSPLYARRADLPPKLCLIGCEYDILCKEAEDLAEGLAEEEKGQKEEGLGGAMWEKGGVRWEKVMGWEHGFDQVPQKGKREVEKLKMVDEVFGRAANWLFREVYK